MAKLYGIIFVFSLIYKVSTEEVYICENSAITLDCGQSNTDLIRIHDVQFGPSNPCSTITTNRSCTTDVTAATRIKVLCNGKPKCVLNDSIHDFTSSCARIQRQVKVGSSRAPLCLFDYFRDTCSSDSKTAIELMKIEGPDKCDNIGSNTDDIEEHIKKLCKNGACSGDFKDFLFPQKFIKIKYQCEASQMNTMAFCKNGGSEITCNSQHIYIESMIILPNQTECNGQQQCGLKFVTPFLTSISDKCNGKDSCNPSKNARFFFGKPCSIQKPILENVNICGTDKGGIIYSASCPDEAGCDSDRRIPAQMTGICTDQCTYTADTCGQMVACIQQYLEIDYYCRDNIPTPTTNPRTAMTSSEQTTIVSLTTQPLTTNEPQTTEPTISTAQTTIGVIKITDKNTSSPSNTPLTIGIAVGVAGLLLAIVAVVVLVCFLRRSKYSSKNNTEHKQTNMIDNNTGHHGVVIPTTTTLPAGSAEYIDLQPHKDNSNYQVLNRENENKDQPSYDYIDTIDYTFRPEHITNDSDKSSDLNHHSVDKNQQKSVSRKPVTVGTAKEQIPTYVELDRTNSGLNRTQIQNDNEASYAILDHKKETGFDRLNKTDESAPPDTYRYNILDPCVTGFNRSNDTNNY